jgi:glycosyltransferase involved in cell wall biosynthesis
MKILQIANKMPYPPKDGGSIATFSLASSFSDLGHDVTVLAMNTSKHYFPVDDIPPETAESIHFIAVNVDTRIKVTDLGINIFFKKIPYNAERFITHEFKEKLRDLLFHEQFDIIQLEGLYLAPYIPTIRESCKTPIAMRAHNVEHEIWERSVKQQSGLKNLYIRNLAKRIKKMETGYLNDPDMLVPITERDAERFRSLGCTLPVKVIPTGIDSSKFRSRIEPVEFPSVFHLGALDWLPNQEGLLWFLDKVWPEVQRQHPGTSFYIAGRNAPEFISRINQPGVEFLGEVDNAYDFMNRKAVMVVPLLSGSGMRIKIIEGMALGKAIVSTPVGAEGISVTHGENILIADTAEKFITALDQLLSNEKQCNDIGAKAVSFIKKNFDNLAIASSLIKFYEEQLGW